MIADDVTTHTYRDDSPAQRVTLATIRRAVILATLALAALCGAVVAVAGPGGYVVQFGACLVVGCAVVAAVRRGRA